MSIISCIMALVRASTLLITSSSISILQSDLSKALARQNSCFLPWDYSAKTIFWSSTCLFSVGMIPDRWVSELASFSNRWTLCRAVSIALLLARFRGSRLTLIEPGMKKGCWEITLICERTSSPWKREIFLLSMVISPSMRSIIRRSVMINDVLLLLVDPQIAIFSWEEIVRSTSCSTGGVLGLSRS